MRLLLLPEKRRAVGSGGNVPGFVTFRSSTVMKVTSNSLGLNLGTLLSVPRVYEI